MKQRINVGAYGWCHKHWLGTFYPHDLPVEAGDDWRLSYYSNEFNCVLVPADYWQAGQKIDCEDWLDSVHADFRFFVECRADMFDAISLVDLIRALKMLAPQLSGLVLLEDCQQLPAEIKKRFLKLSDSLQCELFATGFSAASRGLWRPGEDRVSLSDKSENISFAFFEDELVDLRKARVLSEQFALHLSSDEAVIIASHPRLQAGNLSKFQSVLEIMGY